MDLTTIIGLLLGIFLIIQGVVSSGDINNFIDIPSVIIVIGGTFASVIASYPFHILKEVPKHFKILIMGKHFKPEKIIDQLVEFAKIARQDGMLALEEKIQNIEDPFFKQSLLLVIDALEEEKIQELLESEMETLSARHEEAAGLYEKASAYAPAFGMIGTLVGLINMLAAMNGEDGADSLGANMSVALVTTFYGCVLANVILLPIAKKLRVRNEEELLYRQIIVEGVLAIQAGDNPKFLKEKLTSYLAQKKQVKLLSDPQ
ncbi:MAG: motility protein A [Firmicutes bacterium]|uniref:Motility protein A n=1 Tax=Candidatus Scybalomonas excrementavium TaxID=2840943 RepID=A0A9D9N7Y2_9FIRM|nr:motility protein A [Candidatus Scybalomonas excrementavium]